MNKENEAKKIMLVYERIVWHVIMKHANRLKKNKETLEEDLKSCKTEEERRHAIDYTKNENAIKYEAASDQLDAIYLFANYMRDALCITDPEEKIRKTCIAKEKEAKEKMIRRELDEEAELEKMKKLPEDDPESRKE